MFVVSTRDGEPRPMPGIAPGTRPLRWSADGRTLYVAEGPKVFRVDPVSGRRELWKQFAASDPAGVREDTWFIAVSADGQTYFHSFQVHLSELYLVNGLR